MTPSTMRLTRTFALASLAVLSACDIFQLRPPPPVNLYCAEEKTYCDGLCVSLDFDFRNCGECGHSCATGELCVRGACSTACPTARLACPADFPTHCVDPTSDNKNCGDCEVACDPGLACSSGACSSTCASDQVLCGARCIDPLVSHTYCGASGDCLDANAGTTCADNEVCSGGKCAGQCPSTQLECNGKCVDPQTDPILCGAKDDCKGANSGTACLGGQVCSGGQCLASCPANQIACGGRCIDPLSDLAFCGASGDCKGPNAGARCGTGELCAAGTCGTSCPPGQLNCGGQCVNPKTDPIYCGASLDCKAANAGSTCTNGKVCADGLCGTNCPAGQVVCAGKCIDPLLDPVFCGASTDCKGANAGTTCTSGHVCSAGSCKTSCVPGQVSCNGTCVDPQTNPTYCGATAGCGASGGSVGVTCAPGQVCSGGTCALTCQAGLVECNGKCIEPMTSVTNCGATAGCGVGSGSAGAVCPQGQICTGGACAVSCLPNQVNCNGTCVDPLTSRAYCGATAGCGVGSGSAGATCGAGTICSNGTCQLTCQSGLVSCAGNCIDPQTSLTFCGATGQCGGLAGGDAGTPCGPGLVCAGGVCGVSCPGTLIQCGVSCIDPMSSPLFCGATPGCGAGMGSAGTPCGMNAACSNGACYSVAFPQTVGGMLNGLQIGKSVVLQLNGANNITLLMDGAFTFPGTYLGPYNVTVLTNPVGEVCSVSGGSGVVGSGPVSSVMVTCVPTVTIGGNLTGLPGADSIVLTNNGGDNLTRTVNGGFTFATAISGAYNVQILTQPLGAFCTVTNGTGVTAGSNITNVQVVCFKPFYRVFVTNNLRGGAFGGVFGADGQCQSLATTAGLGGTWLAWISDSVGASPVGRFVQAPTPYKRLDGVTIANDWADLTDGTLAAPISVDQNGVGGYAVGVWTSVTPAGAFSGSVTCGGWNSFVATGLNGASSSTTGTWTQAGGTTCANPGLALYCFEQ